MPTMKTKTPKNYRATQIRLTPRDDTAINKIINKGYATTAAGAIKVALQRFSDEYAA